MLREERHRRITDAVEQRVTVSTEALAHQLNVSVETIRRDLKELESAGRLRRVHGGATSLEAVAGEASFQDRALANLAGKQAIAHAALDLVTPGMTLVLDLGTTAVEVARAIRVTEVPVRVITTSLLVAVELAEAAEVEVIMCPGVVRAGDLSVSGAATAAFMRDIRPDLAFVTCGGIADDAVTDYHFAEVEPKAITVRNARQSYVLADASKIDQRAPFTVCGVDEITGLITDGRPGDQLRKALGGNGATITSTSRLPSPSPTGDTRTRTDR